MQKLGWCLALMLLASLLQSRTTAAPPRRWLSMPQPQLAQMSDAAWPLRLTDTLPGPQSVWMIGPFMAPNPDGQTWDMVLFFSPNYYGPHEVVIIDFGTGDVYRQKVDKVGDERFIFHIVSEIWTGEKLLVLPRTATKKLAVVSYDPASNRLRYHGYPMGQDVCGPGGEHVPKWKLGNDGMLHGPATLGRRVVGYCLNPDTFEVEVSEPFGSERDRTWNYNDSVLDGKWLYFEVGRSPWELFAYNTETKRGKLLAETEPIPGGPDTIVCRRLEELGGCVVSVNQCKGHGGGKTEFWLKDGELTEKTGEAPPWASTPSSDDRKLASIRPKWPEVLVDRPNPEGEVCVRYWLPGPDGTEAPSPHEDAGWKKVTFGVKRYPQPIRRLTTLSDGRIFATTEGYGQAVLLDPLKRKREPLGDTASLHSQAEINELIYMCGYPGSQLWVYDPSQPWNSRSTERVFANGNRSEIEAVPGQPGNPRLLVRLSRHIHPNFHTPLGQLCAGSDGRIYVGGKTVRVGSGGGLAWWDPEADKGGGLRQPFTAYEIHWMGGTDEGRYILCSTKPEADQENPGFHPDKARLFVFDCEQQKLIHEIDAPREIGLFGPVAEASPGRAIGFGEMRGSKGELGVLYGIDVAGGNIVWIKPMPAPPDLAFSEVRRARSVLQRAPDGCLWSIAKGVLMRIRPSDAAVQILGKMPDGDYGQLAFSRGEVYVAGSHFLRRIELPPMVKRSLRRRR